MAHSALCVLTRRRAQLCAIASARLGLAAIPAVPIPRGVLGTAPKVNHRWKQRALRPVGMGCGCRFGTHISVSKERSEWRLLIGAPM